MYYYFTMKKLFLIISLISISLNAQVGIGTTIPNAKSALDIQSNSKGILIPRMTQVQRLAINPTGLEEGLLVYQTDNIKGFYYYDNTNWVNLEDDDWFKLSTTDSPTNINDEIYTNNNVNIETGNLQINQGEIIVSAPSNVTGGITSTKTNNTNSVNTFTNIASKFTSNGTSNVRGISSSFIGSGSGAQTSYSSNFNGNGIADQIGLFNDFRNDNAQQETGFHNLFFSGSTGFKYGLRNTISTPLEGNFYGVYNNVSASGNSLLYGAYTNIGVGAGNQYGYYTTMDGGTGSRYGIYSKLLGTGGGTDYGVYSNVADTTNGYAGYFVGKMSLGNNFINRYVMPAIDGAANQLLQTNGAGQLSFTNASSFAATSANNGLTYNAGNIKLGGTLIQDTNIDYGNFDTRFNLNGTGDFIIQDNGVGQFEINDTGKATFGDDTIWKDANTTGTVLAKLYDSADDGVLDIYQAGTVKNRIHGNGDSFFTGGDVGFGLTNPSYQVDIFENDNTKLRALNLIKNDDTTQPSIGAYFEKNASGTGNSRVLYLLNKGTGTGKKYGIYNKLQSNAIGNQYALRNIMYGNSSSNQTGVFNNIDNTGTGAQYGIYNAMRGANANKTYGVYNEFITPVSNDTIVGVFNSFKEGTPGNSGHVGLMNRFSNNNNGNYFGSKTLFHSTATGTGSKYGSFTSISSDANGTHYGTYNSVSTNKGWAGYFVGKNYISSRLSIGETDEADASLNIRKNSSSISSHIILKEYQENDGARIRFENTFETTNHLIFFGRADNTSNLSRFNFFFSSLNDNVLEIYGDRDVHIKGQLGINYSNPTFAIHLPNNSTDIIGKGKARAWNTYSDSRIKKEQKKIQYGLSTVLKMTPKSYVQYNSTFENNQLVLDMQQGQKDIGFIAQELYKILPEVVQKPKDENKELWSVNYEKIVPVTVKAIQELNRKIEQLEAENNLLKKQLYRLDALEAKINKLTK